MPNFNGKNYELSEVSLPKGQKMGPGDKAGAQRILREEFDIDQAYANGDKILGPLLPEGARVIDAKVLVDGTLGTGGILNLGHQASEDGSIAADDDAFVSAADAGGQAVLKRASELNVGIDKKFAKPVRTELTFTEASSVLTGVKISYHIDYIVN